MAQLRQDYQKFVERDAEVVVIGPESALEFKFFWKKKELPFIGLPDPHQTVLKLYGQEVNLLKMGRIPAQMVIDNRGIARYVHYSSSMSDIPSTQEIISILDELNQKAQGRTAANKTVD
jgi:peroxiredoxin Q/BCP